MPCRFLNCFSHLIITVQVENICDKIQCILVVLNFGVQARQVESVSKVIFVNLAEVFIASRRYELGYDRQRFSSGIAQTKNEHIEGHVGADASLGWPGLV